MPYENIPHVGAVYRDGSFKEPPNSAQPRILILGTATSGLTNEPFRVTNVREAEREFGAATELAKGLHEAIPQGAENMSVMRIGGRQGNLTLTDSDTDTLVITPEYRDDEILDRYALAMEVNSGVQRIAVYDLTDDTWVYDSDEVLVINEGIVEVVDSGLGLFTTGSFTDPDSMKAMSALLTTDFTAVTATTMTTVTATQGTDGTGRTLVEKYAALNTAYHLLDFKDADLVAPMGVYIDDDNVADGDSLSLWAGPPLAGGADSLGYLWQYIYQGKLYTYFTDSATYFTDVGSAVAATVTVNTDLVLTALKAGVGGNSVTIEVDVSGGAGPTISHTESGGILAILVTDDGTSDTATTVTALDAYFAANTTAAGVPLSTLLDASGGAATLLTTVAATPLATGSGPHAATHTELTGEAVPAAVTAAFAAGTDAELRECNFAHQLATFCELASTTWSTMIGSISFKAPTALSRTLVAEWVGELPTYTTIGDDLAVASGNNGVGLLGNKFLAGQSGYRDERVEAGAVTDGYAYGGLIKTQGTSLPNGSAWPYGIDEGDELEDDNFAPVDLGKHILVTYDWPVHRNAYNGGTPYRGQLNVSLLGKIAGMPENEEPIGENGVILKVTSPPRIHSTQLDSLALIRAIGLRFEEGTGWILVSAKTAAHPDSDYTRLSTIRSVNRELSGIRDIAKRFIGKPFDPVRLVALQSDIDGFLQAERAAGFNQGAVASLNYTRNDKILGKLTIRLNMVPPFSIEQITVTTTLAADESEL